MRYRWLPQRRTLYEFRPYPPFHLKRAPVNQQEAVKLMSGLFWSLLHQNGQCWPWIGTSSWSTDFRKTFSFYANRAYQSDSIQWLLNSRYWFSLKDESKTSRISLEFEAVGGWGRVEWSGWRYWDNFKFHVEILCSEFLTLENKLFSICSAIASFILSGSCRCKTALC